MKLCGKVDAVRDEVRDALSAVASGVTSAEVETEKLDFKQQGAALGDTLRSVLDASLCFANWRGGTVVVRVHDKKSGSAAFVGTDLDIDLVKSHVWAQSRPGLLVETEVVEVDGTRLVLVVVPRSSEIHSDTKGRAPRRVGTDCLPMSPAEQRRLSEDKSGFDVTGQVLEASAGTTTSSAMDLARRRLSVSAKSERRALARLTDIDLQRALGLVTDLGEVLCANEILLGRNSCPVTYIFRDTPAGEPRAVERLSGSLLENHERVLELIAARRRSTPLTLPDGQQLQIEDFPELAVREALANALMHRDYTQTDAVLIEHSPQVLVLTSPGPLVSGVTPTNILTHPSKPRNRTLADALAIVELAEEIGRGVDRMYREMVRAGRGLPEITETHDSVRVVLVGGAPDLNIARYVAQLDEALREDTDAMLVILQLCGKKTTEAAEMALILQKTVSEAEAALRQLADESAGVVEPTRQSARRAMPTYRFTETALKKLGTAVPYHRNTSDEISRRVVAHVREYERITNQTVQNLFTVSMARAHQILRGLVDQGILLKTSEAQRGPSVEYGAGPQFPPVSARRRSRKASGAGTSTGDTIPGL